MRGFFRLKHYFCVNSNPRVCSTAAMMLSNNVTLTEVDRRSLLPPAGEMINRKKCVSTFVFELYDVRCLKAFINVNFSKFHPQLLNTRHLIPEYHTNLIKKHFNKEMWE